MCSEKNDCRHQKAQRRHHTIEEFVLHVVVEHESEQDELLGQDTPHEAAERAPHQAPVGVPEHGEDEAGAEDAGRRQGVIHHAAEVVVVIQVVLQVGTNDGNRPDGE